MSQQFKLLVVDDEPIDLRVITAALKDRYEVIPARSGKEALELTKKHAPDLILLDVMMPEMSGYDVCIALKKDSTCAGIPIVFVTAFNTRDGELRGLELGGIDYITKPINFELLRIRVENQLTMKAHLDQITRQKKELEAILTRVRTLEGVIPICMYCKSVRDDKEIWERLEEYLETHTDAQLSHGICPKCAQEKFPQLRKE